MPLSFQFTAGQPPLTVSGAPLKASYRIYGVSLPAHIVGDVLTDIMADSPGTLDGPDPTGHHAVDDILPGGRRVHPERKVPVITGLEGDGGVEDNPGVGNGRAISPSPRTARGLGGPGGRAQVEHPVLELVAGAFHGDMGAVGHIPGMPGEQGVFFAARRRRFKEVDQRGGVDGKAPGLDHRGAALDQVFVVARRESLQIQGIGTG